MSQILSKTSGSNYIKCWQDIEQSSALFTLFEIADNVVPFRK